MATTPTTSPVTAVDKTVGQYVAIRDRLKAMDEVHDAAKKPLLEVQTLLSGRLMEVLKKTGSESIKTKQGTVYISTRYTASLADADAFMKYVVENAAFDLLDRRANATAVKDFVAEKKALPPGCNLNSLVTVGVRRA